MNVYDLQNVIITPVGNPITGYKINSVVGWYIHLPEHDDFVYKTTVILRTDYDFSTVQVVAETDLPIDAEILGGDWDKAENYREITEAEYNAVLEKDESNIPT
jgi:hypothetical protein